jgi:hypothetical protein
MSNSKAFLSLLVFCSVVVGCDSPTDTSACTDEGRSSLHVVATKADVSGAFVPATGVALDLIPAQPNNCYQQDNATTDANGRARLDGVSHLIQWSLRVHPPAGFMMPEGQSETRVVSPTTDTLRIQLHYTPQDTVITLFVADHLVDCVGVAPQKCMLVRTRPEDPYTNFFGSIEGFTFDAGFEYELRVTRRRRPVPLADAGIYTYQLTQIVSKRSTLGGTSSATLTF